MHFAWTGNSIGERVGQGGFAGATGSRYPDDVGRYAFGALVFVFGAFLTLKTCIVTSVDNVMGCMVDAVIIARKCYLLRRYRSLGEMHVFQHGKRMQWWWMRWWTWTCSFLRLIDDHHFTSNQCHHRPLLGLRLHLYRVTKHRMFDRNFDVSIRLFFDTNLRATNLKPVG